jgi:Protein kinase domain
MGQQLGSRYVLDVALGEGAAGKVWRGHRVTDDRPVAIKVLREDLVADPQVVARFLQERQILISVRGPHVVELFDVVVEGETLALVMTLVEGGDLGTLLRQYGPASPPDTARLGLEILDGLVSVHAAGVVHRDIKPENVLVDRSGPAPKLLLTDFGVSRIVDGSALTRGNEWVGTPSYLAPEVAHGHKPTPAADLYSAGCLLYQLNTGHPPFRGDHPLAVLRAHASAAPQQPPHMPDQLWWAVQRLLAKNPQDRPASAVHAKDELKAFLEGQPSPVGPPRFSAARYVATPVPQAPPPVGPPGPGMPPPVGPGGSGGGPSFPPPTGPGGSGAGPTFPPAAGVGSSGSGPAYPPPAGPGSSGGGMAFPPTPGSSGGGPAYPPPGSPQLATTAGGAVPPQPTHFGGSGGYQPPPPYEPPGGYATPGGPGGPGGPGRKKQQPLVIGAVVAAVVAVIALVAVIAWPKDKKDNAGPGNHPTSSPSAKASPVPYACPAFDPNNPGDKKRLTYVPPQSTATPTPSDTSPPQKTDSRATDPAPLDWTFAFNAGENSFHPFGGASQALNSACSYLVLGKDITTNCASLASGVVAENLKGLHCSQILRITFTDQGPDGKNHFIASYSLVNLQDKAEVKKIRDAAGKGTNGWVKELQVPGTVADSNTLTNAPTGDREQIRATFDHGHYVYFATYMYVDKHKIPTFVPDLQRAATETLFSIDNNLRIARDEG